MVKKQQFQERMSDNAISQMTAKPVSNFDDWNEMHWSIQCLGMLKNPKMTSIGRLWMEEGSVLMSPIWLWSVKSCRPAEHMVDVIKFYKIENEYVGEQRPRL